MQIKLSNRWAPYTAAVLALWLAVAPLGATVPNQTSANDVIIIGVFTVEQVPEGKETTTAALLGPQGIDTVPGLRETKVTITKSEAQALTASGSGVLEGLVFETPDGKRQRADLPLTFIPRVGDVIKVFLRDQPAQ